MTGSTPDSAPSPDARYSIGEVSDIVDLEPHVLRYWESEFEELDPSKDSAGRRVYTSDDVHVVERIRELLKEEMYTIAGARKVIAREGITGDRAFRNDLRQMREFLVDLRERI